MNLADKYHPHVFEDVLGQEQAVATVVAQLRRDLQLPILLCGPPGVGKTTVAFILSRALNCEAPSASGSPCLACEKCAEFDTGDRAHFFVELNAGRHGGRDHAAYINDFALTPPFGGARRRAVFIDEAHALSNAAQDQLLQVLELPDTAAFVLATNQPERLTPALRSRCIVVKLDVLSDATLIALGRAVCGWESIAFEPDALAMVAAAAQGQARDFLTKLAAVAAQGPVTAAGVGGVLNLAWADVVLTALTLLLRSGYPEADAALRAWSTLPGLKARALRDALAFVAQQRFALTAGASAGAVHAAFLGASASAVDELAAAVAQRATVLGVAPALCVVEWGVFWSACAAGVHDEGDLALRLMEFALRVCPPEVALTPLPPPVVPVAVRPVRRRAIVCAAAWPDAGLNARRVRRDLLSGESFLYLGRTYRLKVVTDPEIQVGLRNGRLLISQHLLKRAPSARKALRDFYIRRGEEVLPSRVQQLAKKVGVQPGRVRVKELGYHWASCGARGDLNFHWKTLMAPRTVLDYVIVHELCHLRHRDHSNAFWNEIDKILPNYRERKQWLRANGASLDI